jgi:hypothetical protein
MSLTATQAEITRRLRAAVKLTGSRRVIYRTEYLGYLPFGQYHSVTVGGQDVSLQLPEGWEWSDLDALVRAGELLLVSTWVNPQDSLEIEAQYDVVGKSTSPE